MRSKWKQWLSSARAGLNTRALHVGGYSILATLIVIAIVVVINVLVNALPSGVTQFDTTSSGLYTISDQTRELVSGLEEDVTIYWIAQSGAENSALETMLQRYAGMSSHIKVVKKDPDVYPTFAQQYTDEDIYNNSLIVESSLRTRYVSYYDIMEYDYSSYYTTGSYSISFNGEGAITSAIDYVTSEDTPILYTLTGHGEAALSSGFQSAVEQQNIEIGELYLLSAGEVPEDAGAILINAPTGDLAEEEAALLAEWLEGGGNLILITDPEEESGSRPNLDAVMAAYGVTAQEGVVIESDRSYYAMNTPYYLLPGYGSHAITSPLKSDGYYVLLSVAQGLTVSDELPDSVSVTQLLTTSSDAFSKVAGYGLTTYEKEEGDIDGPFALAVAIENTVDDETTGRIVWISSSSLLNDSVNVQVSGGNQDFFLNCVSWMVGETEGITIHAKSLDSDYLTMSSSASSVLTMLVIVVIPAAYLAVGIVIWARRKRR